MTYCVGLWLEAGLVLASDSRTNAGVDYISTYRKLHVFQPSEDRLFVLLAAGNLATTQGVLNRINRDLDRASKHGHHGTDVDLPTLLTADYLFEAAAYIGRLNVEEQNQNEQALRQAGASGEATFILGGQIAGQPHGLYLIYPQGNTIMATPETPYLQIGESKYGKPSLDYAGQSNLSLEDAARLCLLSQVITRKSNLTVGPPFELVLYPKDSLALSQHLTFARGAPELEEIVQVWTDIQRQGLQQLPRFSWEPSS